MRFQGKKSSTIQIRIAAATEYQYLSVKLNSSFEEFGENKLSIITFNYDCSLEHYLLNSLINSHEKTVMNAQRRSRKFRSFTFIASSASGRIAADRLCWK